ncbi:hypothetical protein VDP25_06330 [Winogradskyella sp. ECml5-4]|uniref:hypothetical protein n=1 Tax=Winogradskyella sp. ECml5-4 TaxID=3110975 RepID=UPI002FF3B0B2
MKTKLRLSCSFTFLFILSVAAQVGVGNTNPQAQLDISASSTSSPANSDGILIPRMSNFPSTPGATRDGMLIFYTGTGASGKGFYYWNQTTMSWSALTVKNADWYEFGTSTPPNSIYDNIYNAGQVHIGIGSVSAQDSKLSIVDIDNTLNAGISLQRIHTNNTSYGHNGISQFSRIEGTGGYNGISSTLQSITTSSGNINNYNAVNNISRGDGSQANTLYKGTFNSSTGTSSASKSYGTNIQYSANATSVGDKYGFYIDIDSSLPATHYGVYSDVQNPTGYAGYFLGRTSFGTATTNRYVLPEADGTAGQVMTTDGSGNTSWQNATVPFELKNPQYPDGFTGMTPVIITDLRDSPYTIPAGKNLYITNVFNYGGAYLNFSGSNVLGGVHNQANYEALTNPLIAGNGIIVDANHLTTAISGFLIDANVEPVTASSTYTVPANKILVILNTTPGNIQINSITIYDGDGNTHTTYPSNGLSSFVNPIFADEGQVLTLGGTINGYLINK